MILISKSFASSRIAEPPLMEEAISGSWSPKGFFSKAKILSPAAFPRLGIQNALWPPFSSFPQLGAACALGLPSPGCQLLGQKLAVWPGTLSLQLHMLGQRNCPSHSQGFWNPVPDLPGWGRSSLGPRGAEGRSDCEMGKPTCSLTNLALPGSDGNTFLN